MKNQLTTRDIERLENTSFATAFGGILPDGAANLLGTNNGGNTGTSIAEGPTVYEECLTGIPPTQVPYCGGITDAINSLGCTDLVDEVTAWMESECSCTCVNITCPDEFDGADDGAGFAEGAADRVLELVRRLP